MEDDFIAYVSDESKVAFPWTMIDKITPRPSTEIADSLEASGVEDMQPVITSKRTYIARLSTQKVRNILSLRTAFRMDVLRLRSQMRVSI